jgi:hypothetical protein
MEIDGGNVAVYRGERGALHAVADGHASGVFG